MDQGTVLNGCSAQLQAPKNSVGIEGYEALFIPLFGRFYSSVCYVALWLLV